MRIWDISPGYLNRQSLLGEHRELHGIRSILVNGKRGYSKHPETVRWQRAVSGLVCRHAQLAAEMRLRGYSDHSPLESAGAAIWPAAFVTPPGDQLSLLRGKYAGKEKGRIPLPRNAQDLWAQHKYSVMARCPETYRTLGRATARMQSDQRSELLTELIGILRDRPGSARVANAVEHMWGHVRRHASAEEIAGAKRGVPDMLGITQTIAIRARERFLLSSTALAELAAFVDEKS